MNRIPPNTHCTTPLQKLTPRRIQPRKSTSYIDTPVQLRQYRQINKANQLPQSASIIRQLSFISSQQNHSPSHLSVRRPIPHCNTDREHNREKIANPKHIRYSPSHSTSIPLAKYIHNVSLHYNYEPNYNSQDLSPSSDKSNSMIV
jgi:hypothetical protein